MIVCRDCGKSFAKPTTRGRPPVKCADCRTGKQVAKAPSKRAKATPKARSAQKASKAPKVAPKPVTPARSSQPVQGGLKPGKGYRSGACGGSRAHDGSWLSHRPEIHRLCRADICTCECHKETA